MADETAVLVIHCSDPRYQAGFQEFLKNRLGLERYALLAIPGGPQCLTLAEYLPKFSWAGWRWVKFLADAAHPARVILIAHEDCRWYQDARFGPPPANLRDKQAADLRQVCASLHERFPTMRAEAYYARMAGGQTVVEPL